MKAIKYIVRASILSLGVCLTLNACKEHTLVFPEQIELSDDGEANDRGPVKQNDLTVILDDDEKVKFELQGVDRERVSSIFFSHNRQGDTVITEITDFDEPYVIDNLSLDSLSNITIWAVGHNGLESKPYTYQVKPRPYPSKVIAEILKVIEDVLSVKIDVYNTTNAGAILYYKIDDASDFTSVDLPSPTTDLEIAVDNVPVGNHVLTFYLTDANGGVSETKQLPFRSWPPVEYFTTAEAKALWQVSVSSNQAGDGGGGPALIDGDPNTFWHTPWSGDIPPWPHDATIDFGEEITLTKFIFRNRHNNGGNAPKDIDLQVSDDGVNFTTHQSFFNTNTGNGAEVTFDITTPIKSRYVRISNKTGYNGSWVNYGEISFAGYRD